MENSNGFFDNPVFISGILKALDNYFGFIFVTDGTGQPVFINKNAAACMGVSREEILKTHCREFQDKGFLSESVVMAVVRSKETKTKMIVYPRTGRNIIVKCSPLFNDAGELILTVSFSQEEAAISELIEDIEKSKDLLKQTVDFMEDRLIGNVPIIAESHESKRVFQYARLAASSEAPVLISGETGTGKEVMAHYIHEHSSRKKAPFIPVNCGAIPSDLMESSFFGYTKGSFTGADANGKVGFFDMSNHGTLFLDEIGELPLDLQPKLLRAIETQTITPVGGRPHAIDIRIVSATNRNLIEMVKDGAFRKDLFYRLNVIPISIPPLRERSEDIPLLLNVFLESYNRKYKLQKFFSEQAKSWMMQYKWPGNIRELRNLVERLVLVSQGSQIDITQDIGFFNIPDTELLDNSTNGNKSQYSGTLRERVKKFEKSIIKQVLQECDNDVDQACDILAISRSSFYNKK